MLAMDDVGRCLLDVIDDPQLLQSFLENTNGAIGRENLHNSLHNNPNHKSIASVKPIDPKLAANISIATQFSDTKQVDHVTSSGGNRSPLQSINKPTSGQLVIDEKQTINMVSSSVGLIPVSALSNAVTATSLSIAQPTLTAYTTTASVGQMSTTMRTSAQGWPPTQFQLANPRGGGALTVQMPQQFLLPPGAMQMTGPGGIQQLVLTRPGVPHGGIPPGIQPGQLVQIIQTPSGPQILPTNPTATVQSIVSTSVTTKSSSTTSSSRSNKQILPKPPGSSVSATNAVTTNSNNKCQQMTQQNTLKVINSLPNAPQFASAQIPTSGAAGHQTQQILIGPGGHPVISGPQGTFLLNHMIPGIGGQPILINGNLGNGIPNSFQLTLRPNTSHGSSMMTMSNGLTAPLMSASENNTNILNALNANVAKQTPTQSPQPQTFVIPNHSTAVSSAAPGMVVTNAGRPAPNIIFTRPQMMGAPQSQPQGQQFLQLQTPNGPILVALQTQPQLIPQQQASASQPTHGIQLGNHMIPIGAQHMSSQLAPNLNASIQTAAAHPALHALLTHTDNTSGQTVIQTSVPSVVTSNTHVILTSQPQIITRPQLQQSQSQQLKHSSAPSLNLAELLKEHGILPESSPPSSPTNNSLTDITTGAIHSELIHPTQQSHQTVLMVPSGPNQPPNIVLTQNPVQATAPPQLRLALGPDGSVILQPHITTNTNGLVPQIQSQFISNSNNLKFNESLKDSSGLGSSQPSPDSTTPSIDSTSTSSTNATLSQTTTTSTTTTPSAIGQNTSTTSTSALLDQLNTGPAVKVPDIVASLALTHHSSTGPAVTEESKPIQSQTALIPLTVQNINNSLEQQKQTILTIPVQSGDNNVVQNGSNGSSNAVIRIGSCDTIPTSLVLTTTPTTVFASPPPKTLTTGPIAPIPTVLSSSTGTVSVTGTTTTVIDHNGVPMIQVSPNNQEFLQRLDTQLKNLLLLKSPTNQQKELLQELLSLQQKLNVARSKNTSDDQKLILTTASTINISPQTQQALQSSPNNQMSIDSQSQQQTPQNVHLMNLLKQTPVNQSSASQIRLLTPASAAPVNGTATIQVGNQLITFTTPVKQQLQNLKSIQTSNQTISKPQLSAPTPTVILRYHTPTPTTSSTLVTTSTTTKPSIIKNDTQDKERRNAKILKSIQQQLNVDQNAALKPDTKKPFNSRDDACKRLLRYHVFNAPVMSTSDMDKSDRLFEMVSQHLLHKKQQLFDKFRVLLLKQSMKETPSSEHVMIDRMFINEEMSSLKADRETVAEGKSLNLPPAPQSWCQMIRSSIEEDEKLSINRKRKSSIGSDDEYNHQNSQMRRHEEPVEESEESDDEDDDSDDEENDDKDDTISNFLQSTSETNLGNLENIGHYYGNYQNNLHIQNGSQLESQSHVPLSGFVDTTQQHNELDIYSDINEDNCAQDWTDSILNNNSANRRIAWNHRFGVPESEAAVAVESILNDDDDDDEPDMSVDLSGIEGLDDNLEVDNEEEEDDDEEDDDDDDDEEEEEEDDDEDVVDGYGMGGESHQLQQHVDVQMQCAIKSILDMPSVGQQSHPSHNSYAFHTHNTHTSHQSMHPHINDYRNLDYPHIPSIHDQRRNDAMMRPYSQHSAGVNDPILDEAVKSILS